jgi:hypothetical protein
VKKLFRHDWAIPFWAFLAVATSGWMIARIVETGGGMKSGGLVVIGPLSICYGLNGLFRRQFPDFGIIDSETRPLQFWSIGIGFFVSGVLMTIGGIAAFAA